MGLFPASPPILPWITVECSSVCSASCSKMSVMLLRSCFANCFNRSTERLDGVSPMCDNRMRLITMGSMKKIFRYATSIGRVPYTEWKRTLKDGVTVARIEVKIDVLKWKHFLWHLILTSCVSPSGCWFFYEIKPYHSHSVRSSRFFIIFDGGSGACLLIVLVVSGYTLRRHE